MNKLSGKVALITGAGQGIGRGMSLALAKEGVAVAVVGRTESKLVAVCEEIRAFGGAAEPFACDVTVKAQVEALPAAVVEAFGGLDILINNARDRSDFTPLHEVSDEDFLRSNASGPIAVFRLMKAAYPHLKARGGGSIVNFVTSAAVRWDVNTFGAYTSSKEGVRMLTRTAACDWGPDNIRANSIGPLAETAGFTAWRRQDPAGAEAFVKSVPLGRLADPERDIGRFVCFLVSDDGEYLTGQTFGLDGGQARWS